MKTIRSNKTQSSDRFIQLRRISKRTRIGLSLALTALFLCSLSASAVTCTPVTGVSLTQIAVGTTQVWGLDSGGNIYQYDHSTKVFNVISGNLSQIAVGEGKTVWGINSSGEIYQYDFTTLAFVHQGGTLKLSQISAGEATSAGSVGVWGVGLTGGVHYWNGLAFVTLSQKGFPPKGATIKYISVGQQQPFALDSAGHAYLYNNTTGFFDGPLGAASGGEQVLSQISVGSDLFAWGINDSDDIFVYNDGTEQFEQVSSTQHLSSISVLNSDVPWGLGETSGRLYKYSTTTFQQQCTTVDTFKQVAAGATATATWAITTSGEVYMF
jgi:virginiamycin B lyase